MRSSVFKRLFGLFILLLLVQTLVTVIVFHRLVQLRDIDAPGLLVRYAFWSSVVALAIGLPLAALFARGISRRLQRVVSFARNIAGGDLSSRLHLTIGHDEFSEMETALNRTAERIDADVEELQRGRQELAAILDAMQEGILAINRDGQIRWSNAVMGRIAGTQIRPGSPLVHAVRDPEFLGCIRGALERRELCFGRATSISPGKVFDINAAPLPSGGALIVLHDVTGIEGAQKAYRDFVANVSHELRTPLTSIQGYAETIIEDPSPDPEITREFLNIILKNASRMNRLTEDLLILASVESPDYKLALQPAAAASLVKDAIQSMMSLAVDAGIDLQFAGAPEDCVLADPYAMHQVFGNLIQNSLKYAREGKRIRVGAQALASEMQFTIRDFGPGIASEHLERIFERFYRVDKARSRESGGTGLGLAIVRHIIQTHGGRIWAESELGKGTSFHFTLPLAPTPQAEFPIPESSSAV